MNNLTQSPRLRLLTLCALYTAQGIPWGFVTVTLVAYLADKGLETAEIGNLTAFASLPWALKFVWGPIIDRFGIPSMGRRRPWILLAQLMMALTVLAMVLIDDLTAGVATLTWMVFTHNIFNSLQDVAVDALAVDILEDDERGRANGFMWASKYGGIAIGGAGMASVMAAAGMRTALLVQVASLLLIMLLPLFLRERDGEKLLPWTRGSAQVPVPEPEGQTRLLMSNLRRAFSIPAARWGALLALLIMAMPGLATVLLTVMCTKKLGWTPEEIAHLTGGWGVLMGVIGAIVGGLILDRIGAKTIILVSSLAFGALLVALGLLESSWEDRQLIYIFALSLAGVNAAIHVGLFSMYMAVSWPVVAGTQFTAYMTLLNISMAWGQKATGALESNLGYGTGLVAMGIFHGVAVLVVLLMDPGQTRRVLGSGVE